MIIHLMLSYVTVSIMFSFRYSTPFFNFLWLWLHMNLLCHICHYIKRLGLEFLSDFIYSHLFFMHYVFFIHPPKMNGFRVRFYGALFGNR